MTIRSKTGKIILITVYSFVFRHVLGAHPKIFVPTSSATCQVGYGWMDNAESQDPCLMTAYVIAACDGQTWTQPALPSGYSYDSPNGTTVTPCYCSWSCYNLMMACTICQNPAYVSDTKDWPTFSENCPSNYKDQGFPPGYVLDGNSSIPYWAMTNPTTWQYELFDVDQAQTIFNQNHPDYKPSTATTASNSSSSGSNANVGAIVGGTVGGAAAILLILIGGYFMYKRKQYRRLQNTGGATPAENIGKMHSRLPSDPSSVFSSTVAASTPSMSQMTTHQGMGLGINGPNMYSSFQIASPPPTETASFVTAGNIVEQRTRAIPIV